MHPLLTIEEAAEALRVKPTAVRKWLSQRRIPRRKVGSLTRIPRTAIEQIVAKGLPRLGE